MKFLIAAQRFFGKLLCYGIVIVVVMVGTTGGLYVFIGGMTKITRYMGWLPPIVNSAQAHTPMTCNLETDLKDKSGASAGSVWLCTNSNGYIGIQCFVYRDINGAGGISCR